MAYPPKAKAGKLFHSEIAQSPNGVELRFISDVKPSKFPDGQPYVFVEKRDGTECLFVVENDDIKSVIDNTPQKKWVVLKGEGKGPGAWMIVEDESGPVMGKTPTPQAPAANPPQDKPVFKDDPESGLVQYIIEVCDAALIAYGRMEAGGHPFDSAGKSSIWSTIFINK